MLNKTSYVPLSHQIYDIICKRIIAGAYPVGSLLPSQDSFAQEFSVSMITIRQAFQDLSARGFIKSQRGKGSHVIGTPSTYQGLHSAHGFTADSKISMSSLETKVLHIKTPCPHKESAFYFHLEGNAPVLVNRLRIVNGIKASLEYSYLNPDLLPFVDWAGEIIDNRSLYEFIKHKFQYVIVRAEEQIAPVMPPPQIRDLLSLDKDGLILFIKRLTYVKSSALPFEYCEYYILPEYYGRVIYTVSEK